LETTLAMFCQTRIQQGQNVQVISEQELARLDQQSNLTDEQKRAARQTLQTNLRGTQQSLPRWKRHLEDHQTAADKHQAAAQDNLKKALTLAQSETDKREALLALAQFKIQDDANEEAYRLVQDCIDLDPNQYAPYLLAAAILRQQATAGEAESAGAKLDLAVEMLDRRLNQMPPQLTGPDGWRNRMLRTQLMMTMTDLLFARQAEGDAAMLDRYIDEIQLQTGTEDYRIHQLKGRKALLDQNVLEAIKCFEEADRLANENAGWIKLILAQLHLQRNQTGAAKTAVDQALQMNPSSEDALTLAATVYLRLDDPVRVLSLAEQLLSLPKLSRDQRQKGLAFKLEALARLDRLDEADAVAEAMVEAGADLDWQVQKAQILAMRGRVQEAESLLNTILREHPDHKDAAAILSSLYFQTRRVDQAKQVLQTALEKYPDDRLLQRRMELLSIEDDEARASRAAEMDREDREARLMEEMKLVEGESDPYVRAVKLFDQYLRQNNMEEAKKHLAQASEIDPKRANAVCFRFAVATKDWAGAQKCVDLAKVENLDTVGGAYYEGQLANARGWELLVEHKNDEAKTKFSEAARSLELAVAELPQEAVIRAMLGEAYFVLERAADAREQIGKALELSPTNPYALRAQSLLQWDAIARNPATVNPQLVQAFAGTVQRGWSQLRWDPWLQQKAQWLTDQAKVQQAMQDDARLDAQTVLTRRIERRQEKPDDLQNLIRLAWIYENREEVRDLDKAEECYQGALSQAQATSLTDAYLQFASRHDRVANVESYLRQQAQKLAESGNADGYSLVGYFYEATQKPDQAEEAFSKTVEVEDALKTRLNLAVFHARHKQLAKAVEWAFKAVQSDAPETEKSNARVLLIEVLMENREWEEAGKQADQFASLHPEDPRGGLLQARLAINQGRMTEAVATLSQILEKTPGNTQALQERANAYIYMWKLDEAMADLEKHASINPAGFGLDGRVSLIKLYCELDRTADAVQEARKIIETPGLAEQPALLEAIRDSLLPALASAMDPQPYEELLVWAGSLHGSYWGWPYEQGLLHMREERFGRAAEVLQQAWTKAAQSKSPMAATILNTYLEALLQAGQPEQTVSVAREVLTQGQTADPQVLAWMSAALFKLNQEEAGTQALVEALRLLQSTPPAVWHITRNCLLKVMDAPTAITRIESLLGQSDDAVSGVKLALATACFAAKQPEKAYRLCQEVVAQEQDAQRQLLVWYIAGQELTDNKAYSEALEALNKARELDPDSTAALNNIAYIYVEFVDRGDEGVQLIEQAYRGAPNNADLLDTYGRILERIGQKEKAMVYLAKSIWIKASAASRFHLGQILLEQGRRHEAQVQFRQALAMVGEDKVLEGRIRDALKSI